MGRNLNSPPQRHDISGPVIVEFVGLPGVGKSTLSRRVAAALATDHSQVTEPIHLIDNRSGPHRVLSKGRFAAEHALRRPQTALSLTRILFSTDQASTADRIRVGFNLQYVAGVISRARSTSDVALLDQGPYQGVWSVGFRSSTDWATLLERFDRFLSLTAPDLVVLVEADTDIIVDRLRSRECGDTRFAPDKPAFDRGVDGYNLLKHRIQSAKNSESIVVKNETHADLDAGANRIAAAVESLRD